MKPVNKLSFLLFLSILTFSCQTEEEKLKEKIEPVLRDLVLRDSLVAKLDSLKIVKIDTLTELEYASMQMLKLANLGSYYAERSKFYDELSNEANISAKSNLKLARRYLEVLESASLASSAHASAIEHLNKSGEFTNMSQVYADSVKYFFSKIDSIKERISKGEVDSVNLKGYIPIFKIIGADKKGFEVRKDSLNVLLSENLNVIPVNIK